MTFRACGTPGERFSHMVETLFGLARLGHTDNKGMPNMLQLALIAQEFSDIVVFSSPPPAVQRLFFSALAHRSHACGAIARRIHNSRERCWRRGRSGRPNLEAGQCETAVIEAGVWHDWWNASNHNARVRVEVALAKDCRLPGALHGHLALKHSETLDKSGGGVRREPSLRRAR